MTRSFCGLAFAAKLKKHQLQQHPQAKGAIGERQYACRNRFGIHGDNCRRQKRHYRRKHNPRQPKDCSNAQCPNHSAHHAGCSGRRLAANHTKHSRQQQRIPGSAKHAPVRGAKLVRFAACHVLAEFPITLTVWKLKLLDRSRSGFVATKRRTPIAQRARRAAPARARSFPIEVASCHVTCDGVRI